MKIFADYHTHTIYSHGKGTIEDNVLVGIERGLEEIAISDHGFGHSLFGIKEHKFEHMLKEIREMNEKYPAIHVKLGMECNIISQDGQLDVSKDTLDQLDIVLAGYHFGALPKRMKDFYHLYGKNFISGYIGHVSKKMMIKNTDAIVAAIYNHSIDILTHPGDKMTVDIKEVAKACRERKTALEINSSHGHLTTQGIEIAMKEGANFVISSDAHVPQNVGNVQAAIDRAIEARVPIDHIINAKEE